MNYDIPIYNLRVIISEQGDELDFITFSIHSNMFCLPKPSPVLRRYCDEWYGCKNMLLNLFVCRTWCSSILEWILGQMVIFLYQEASGLSIVCNQENSVVRNHQNQVLVVFALPVQDFYLTGCRYTLTFLKWKQFNSWSDSTHISNCKGTCLSAYKRKSEKAGSGFPN